MNAIEIKQRWPEAFAAYQTWWRALTKTTDPSRVPDLSWEAFKAGHEIAKAEGLPSGGEQVRSEASHPNPPDTGRLREALEELHALEMDYVPRHLIRNITRRALSASPSVGRAEEKS